MSQIQILKKPETQEKQYEGNVKVNIFFFKKKKKEILTRGRRREQGEEGIERRTERKGGTGMGRRGKGCTEKELSQCDQEHELPL